MKASYEEKVERLVVQVRELEEQVLRGEIGGGREGGVEEKGGRVKDGVGRRKRRNRSRGGEHKEAEEWEKAEERDVSAVYGIPLSPHEDAKREREEWMHTVVPTVAKKGEGKANVVQRLCMLLEQTTDSRDREESEWPLTSWGGTGVWQPGTGGVPLPAGSTAMERLMSAVSGSLGQVAYETAHVLWMPHIYKLHIPVHLSQQLLKTGLKQKQIWKLSKIQVIYGDKILADLSDCSAEWKDGVLPRQNHEDFVNM
ncbi:uncharacterized protein MONOS_8428 [Monocercomonoides exilis]|uniref:uncharacterized protein n=1 Tax=Monocercomonoides exilis TaxID=2049356 RepID=UPI00355AAF66|nr:hypothetical protein MONOS_8428 [Monocercomonoides exilis]|eukprot:MONOS_8428.1-p1 / transcript=MONOS_8428.1 / gene=MONOS_8428 / organism=Monocercomonoides_exilis_PA203 / gene_product=unspecified product / transcript_product=unspecified product / location=Mono_scaffold00317:24215-24979(-) / protein_length=255 / sequence_SO=supercontig / SO=protein_coding / is_pseudo=false